MTEEECRSCSNCEKVCERRYSNGGITCFGIVREPFRACDIIRSCQTFDGGKEFRCDYSLDEAAELSAGFATIISEYLRGAYERPCEDCTQKTEDCFVEAEPVAIGGDGLCQCSCADPCPLYKVGSQHRCSEKELQAAGIKTVRRANEKV
jgi:hypothetical protein